MSAFELTTLLIAFIALVISILTFAQSSINSILALKEADRANKTAEKSLEISMHDHKIKLLPKLAANVLYRELILASPEKDVITLLIWNKAYARAKITGINVIGIFDLKEFEPCELGLNNKKAFMLNFVKEQREKLATEANEDNSAPRVFEILTKRGLKGLFILIAFNDSLDNKYNTLLMYNEKNDAFEGEPIEKDSSAIN